VSRTFACFFEVGSSGAGAVLSWIRARVATVRARRRDSSLVADHDLSTGGVIGSIVDAHEDSQGARIRAKFASTERRRRMSARSSSGFVSSTVKPTVAAAGRMYLSVNSVRMAL
jgi:uncharacterized OB-fold protein